ncbi:N-formylglutamate amidohydrolase [Sulfitobacter sp. F26204]|uniref:N-formylglutamate amidohydrolase n=1 Tax=Sulfitobacter sp. F26204 TaxID=2996014 RepID=UPI00225DD3F5|nr:N-formylglutamate amidohydrolase [Sulfitobacter sp. F26204]MCX7559029.1 N-formylglutamate amidohydrolase [Sulfitobacter sp. F26204]
MSLGEITENEPIFDVVNPKGSAGIVLVCEHASAFIPPRFDGLGLSQLARDSHAAWDPGALAVATHLSQSLDAPLVAACTSRLVYDLNRATTAPDAMPSKSEVFEIPGNARLTDAERRARITTYYTPFHAAVADVLASKENVTLVTIHSFTRVYHGKERPVEIGILHDSDARLGDAMLAAAAHHTHREVRRNEPYGPQDGVTHMLQEHGVAHDRANVMIEIRNDLIETETAQRNIAAELAGWLDAAISSMKGAATCKG